MSPTTRIEGDIPVDLKVSNGKRYLFISKDQRSFTHSIHKYPAKFFPELPRWLILKYSKQGDKILDPFMGSGTTNLEAMLNDRDSVGVDIDPFSRLLAKVKTTPLNEKKLDKVREELYARIVKYNKKKSYPSPDFPYKEKWFCDYVINELAHIKKCIENLKTTKNIKDFLLVCFSSIVRRVSQADDKCTRTVIRKKLNKEIKEGYAIKLFMMRLDKAIEGVSNFSKSVNGCRVKIPKRVSATNMSLYGDNEFDLAVTSPPYVNAVDYPRTHQLEMYWLGLVNGSLTPLKRKHVGTETVNVEEYKTLQKTGIRTADRIIKQIYDVDKRRAYIATKYICDMTDNLKEVYRVLKPDSRYIIVVGSNSIRGQIFENWKYIRDSALQVGYTVEVHFISEIINHFIKVPRKERIDDDHLLVLRK